MGYQLTDNERRQVIDLSADERYDYFISKVVESGEIWSLRSDEGWVLVTSEDGEESLPVWPHHDFAGEWATGEWADCRPEAIPLDVWLERWIPGMERDGSMIAIFPSEAQEGVVVAPGEMLESIEIERN